MYHHIYEHKCSHEQEFVPVIYLVGVKTRFYYSESNDKDLQDFFKLCTESQLSPSL